MMKILTPNTTIMQYANNFGISSGSKLFDTQTTVSTTLSDIKAL